ncbi:hypothetical protein PsYK624_068700 [Phanerochaete sordida]|uniref:BTB domain-containing protein n=1 Tax=Phanerochaete sordida TaxID=48140 RepID=A0A9P3G9F3_9APHY|nr:hypothetical protein PsYK624_068700 [Phanerochaete sordida]
MDDYETATAETLEECRELWFDDGNVVLQAGNMIFCVHRGLLAQRSSYMKELFETISLTPPQYQVKYKSLPLICINSSAEDARILLSAVYDRNVFESALSNNQQTFALLEQSTRYDFKDLRAVVLDALTPYFPTTLDAWSFAKPSVKEHRPFSKRGSLIAFANIALHAAPHFLPAALLKFICCNDISRPSPVWYKGYFRGKVVELSPALKTAILRGRSTLDQIARTKIFSRIWRTPLACTPGPCAVAKKTASHSLARDSDGIIKPFATTLDLSTGWCNVCRRIMEDDWQTSMPHVWYELPWVFGLPEWDELLKDAPPPRTNVEVMDIACAMECEELWYPDGTVVLQAGFMRFRVYKGVLSKHSSVFADMFAMPQPVEAGAYEGCPLVVIHDSEEDTRAFLHALHSPDVPRAFIDDERLALTLLRMSHKYAAHKLRTTLLRALEPCFPTQLVDWEARLRTLPERTAFTTAGAIVQFANIAELAAPHLLPAAILALVPFCAHSSGEHPFGLATFRGVPVKPEHRLVRAVVQAREALDAVARTEVYLEIFNPGNPDCVALEGCDAARANAIAALADADGLISPFAHTKSEPGWRPEMFCGTCRARLERRFASGLRSEWKRLPERLALPGWDVLSSQVQDVEMPGP